MTIIGHGPHRGFKVPGRSTQDIRNAAMGLRSVFAISGPRFDAETTLERLSFYSVTVDVVDDADHELPQGVEACWVPDTTTLSLRQSVYVSACQRGPRALFTVAHELGHLALGHRRTFNRDMSGVVRTFEDSEWQADTFAGEFLMPLDLVLQAGITSAIQLKDLFGVSLPAAQTRFNKLQGRHEIV